MHDANMSDRQGKSELCVHREPTGRVIIVIVTEREEKDRERHEKKKRGRHERIETREEKRETLPCVRRKRSRVYVQNARVLCDTGV